MTCLIILRAAKAWKCYWNVLWSEKTYHTNILWSLWCFTHCTTATTTSSNTSSDRLSRAHSILHSHTYRCVFSLECGAPAVFWLTPWINMHCEISLPLGGSNYVLDTLVDRFHWRVFMCVRLQFNATGNSLERCVLSPRGSAGERGERGSPVDGDELLGGALLSRRGHLPAQDRSEWPLHVCVCL